MRDHDPGVIADAYFSAWLENDRERLRAPPGPTANWSRVEDGRITRIQVTFDPRPLAPPG
jgi:hypothetical protein